MKTESPAPLVSDEQIIETSERIYPIPSGLDPEDEEESDMIERIKGDQLLVRRGMREARIVYESELTKMRAERDDLVGALRKANDELHRIAWAHSGEIRDGETNPMVSVLKSNEDILSKYKTE